jgi:hypothetical protein
MGQDALKPSKSAMAAANAHLLGWTGGASSANIA